MQMDSFSGKKCFFLKKNLFQRYYMSPGVVGVEQSYFNIANKVQIIDSFGKASFNLLMI